MKVLVICDETIGDVVFATPVIRALKVQLDDVEVHALFSPRSVFLAAENPYIDKFYTMQKSVVKTWRLLKAEKYDVVIRLRTDVRSKILTTLLRAKVYSLKPTGWEEWLLVRLKINRLVNIHLVDRLMGVLKPLSVRTDELGLDFFIPEKDKVLLNWLPEIFQKGYVVLLLTASYTTRKLPVNRVIELCDKINKPIILLGNKEDTPDGEAVSNFFTRNEDTEWDEGLQKLGKSTMVYNACGKFNFNQMASIVKQSRAVFTFDSDFIPVASALRKEIFCLWGNTILLFGRYPYRTRFTVLESDKASCRPCSTGGFNSCPKGHFRCMNTILFDFYLP
jgi:ADP-heptose:LPS heptosyltransferase